MKQEVILKYDGSFQGFLSGVFSCYEEKLQVIDILVEGNLSQSLFYPIFEVFTDPIKADRVWNAVTKRTSSEARRRIRYAFLSGTSGMEIMLLKMIKYIFSHDTPVDSNFAHPVVLKIAQVAKKVAREKHRMEAFVRFRLTQCGIYFALIEPDFNVLPLLIPHFKERYQDQKWIIYDGKRKLGIAFDLEMVSYVSIDLDPKIGPAGSAKEFFDQSEPIFQELWSQYFSSTNIPGRVNKKLHLQHLPPRYWKFLTEKVG